MGVTNFWLLDGTGSILGYEPKRDRPSTKICAEKVKLVISRDNVHFLREGYKNIAQCIFVSILGMFKGTLTKPDRSTVCTVSGSEAAMKKKAYLLLERLLLAGGRAGDHIQQLTSHKQLQIPSVQKRPKEVLIPLCFQN
jgi:hypothetical protein